MSDINFNPVESITLTIASSSVSVQKSFSGAQDAVTTKDLLLTNKGTVPVWVIAGTSAVKASKADGTKAVPLLAGAIMIINKGVADTVSVILDTGSTSCDVVATSGQGN